MWVAIDLTSSPDLAPDDSNNWEDVSYHETDEPNLPSPAFSSPTAATQAPSIAETQAPEEDDVTQEVTEGETKEEEPKHDDNPEVQARWDLKAKLKRIGYSKWVDKLPGSPPTKDDLLEAWRKGKRCKRVADGTISLHAFS